MLLRLSVLSKVTYRFNIISTEILVGISKETLLTKVCIVKAMVCPVITYGCESWIIKKAEHKRIDAFELWCWRRPLRVSWTARRSNQSVLQEINPEYSLEELMLKLQYFGHLMRRTDSLEKTLMLGKIERRRRRGRLKAKWLDSITDSMHMCLSKLGRWWRTEKPGMLQSMGHKELDTTSQLNNKIYINKVDFEGKKKNKPFSPGLLTVNLYE